MFLNLIINQSLSDMQINLALSTFKVLIKKSGLNLQNFPILLFSKLIHFGTKGHKST